VTTVWCATLSTPADARARSLREGLHRVGEAGVDAALLDLASGEQALAKQSVGADDVVILHGAATTALTRAIRDAGAYALQRLDSGTRASTARAVDAYLLSWQSRGVECLAAVIPRTHALARRDIGLADGGRDRRRDLAWASLVGEVTDGDRHETVGGAIHARPFVATR
jgi:hypothetical protein